MYDLNVYSITGNSNIVGSNNIVTNSLSTDDIIRDEANRFTRETLEGVWSYPTGPEKFFDLLQVKLRKFYSSESKSIFLDQVLSSTKDFWALFCKNNPNHKSFLIKYTKFMFFVEQEREQLPKIIMQSSVVSTQNRTKVFISYSRKDKQFLDDLKRHFKPFEHIIDFWDDSKIEPGEKWKEKIQEEIENAKVAVLLISADFFNSEFILNNELPRLLDKAEKDGAKILSVILKHCLFDEYKEINKFQAINYPNVPIASLSDNDREAMWVQLVKEIRKSVELK